MTILDIVQALLMTGALAVVLSLLAFWIWMLVDCLTKESKEGQDRLVGVPQHRFGDLDPLGGCFCFGHRYPLRAAWGSAVFGGCHRRRPSLTRAQSPVRGGG